MHILFVLVYKKRGEGGCFIQGVRRIGNIKSQMNTVFKAQIVRAHRTDCFISGFINIFYLFFKSTYLGINIKSMPGMKRFESHIHK